MSHPSSSSQSYFPAPSTQYVSQSRSSLVPSYSPYQQRAMQPMAMDSDVRSSSSAVAGPSRQVDYSGASAEPGSYYSYNPNSAAGIERGYGPGTMAVGSGSGSGSGSSSAVGAPDQETFDFMKRKKWPQLLMQELIGAAVWCIVPYQPPQGASLGANHSGWKVVFASPATTELLGYKPEELENRDWGEFIFPLDLPRLLQSISSTISPAYTPLISPGLTYQTSNSRTSSSDNLDPSPAQMDLGQGGGMERFAGPTRPMSSYARLMHKEGGDVLFELRGHAHHTEDDNPETPASEVNGGFDNGGIMGLGGLYPTSAARGARDSIASGLPGACKAFWLMGRKWVGQGETGSKMLDSFLELKMENERLRQELKALQAGQFDIRSSISSSSSRPPVTFPPQYNPGYMRPNPYDRSANDPYNRGSDDSDDDMGSASPPKAAPKLSQEDKKQKKAKNGKATEYLCRNCGRNDSPEWRKGPLGAKTLCNACGLRWAKRNAGPPGEKKRKDKERETDEMGS